MRMPIVIWCGVSRKNAPSDDSATFLPKTTASSISVTPMIVASLILPLRHTNM